MIRLLLLLGLIGAGMAIKLLPWYVTAGILVGSAIVLKLVAGRLLERLLLVPFRAKGRVLRGARARIHSIREARVLRQLVRDEDVEESEDTAARRWLIVETTISPAEAPGTFRLWEPGELRLVPPGAPDGDDPACVIERVEVAGDDGAFADDEGGKVEGERRLRLRIGIGLDVDRLQFCYYLERFGGFRLLPRATPAPAPAEPPLVGALS